MFVLPTLILPLVFAIAVFRLYDIPRQLWQGKLRLPGGQRIVLHAATISAYAALLGYTLALGIALTHALLAAQDRSSAYLALLGYMAVYPLVYFFAAWIFYYGLQPAPKPEHQIR